MPKPAKNKPAAPVDQGGDAPPPAFGGVDIGIHLIVCVLAGGALGYALDRWWGVAPLGMFIGGVAGFGAWLTAVWRLMNSKNK